MRALFLIGLLVGCGSETTPEPVNPLLGSWFADCHQVSEVYYTITTTITHDTWINSATVHTDDACKQPAYTRDIVVEHRLRHNSRAGGSVIDHTLTPHMDELVTEWNETELMEVTEWQLDAPYTIGSAKDNDVRIGAVYYIVYELVENTLRYAFSRGDYPDEPGDLILTKQP